MVTYQRHGCALERNELQQLQDSPSAAGRSSPGSPRNASTSPSTCLVKTNPRQQRQKVDLTNAIYPRNRSSLTGFTAEREITKPIDPGEAISGLAPCGAAWMLHTNKKGMFRINFTPFLDYLLFPEARWRLVHPKTRQSWVKESDGKFWVRFLCLLVLGPSPGALQNKPWGESSDGIVGLPSTCRNLQIYPKKLLQLTFPTSKNDLNISFFLDLV